MATPAYNTKTREWKSVDDVENLTPTEDWIINPTFNEFERAQELGPRFWKFNNNVISPMTDEEIDANTLFVNEAKLIKVNELSEACRLSIISGFESSALGSTYIYDSEEVDQLNLVGAVSTTAPTPEQPAGYTIYYAVRDPITNIKSYQLHTHFQLRQVLADGANVKLTKLQKFAVKRATVEALTTISGINAITWDSNP